MWLVPNDPSSCEVECERCSWRLIFIQSPLIIGTLATYNSSHQTSIDSMDDVQSKNNLPMCIVLNGQLTDTQQSSLLLIKRISNIVLGDGSNISVLFSVKDTIPSSCTQISLKDCPSRNVIFNIDIVGHVMIGPPYSNHYNDATQRTGISKHWQLNRMFKRTSQICKHVIRSYCSYR